jgi:hypothetical protein
MEQHGQDQAPQPGTWLQVSSLDQWIEEYVALGDLLYFRAETPMGLFECYSPKLDGPFFIDPKHVRAVTDL